VKEQGGDALQEGRPSRPPRRHIQARRDRNPELFHLYTGMNTAMDQLCATYTTTQLELLADFHHRTTAAGQHATDRLAND
jgi:hypothetical protein